MLIGGKEYDQVIITRQSDGRIEAEKGEVIAVISDDNELIIKNGYDIELVPAK